MSTNDGPKIIDLSRLVMDPREACERYLIPGVREALRRGGEKYGDTWVLNITGDYFCDAEHTIERHVKCELARALQALDYGDREAYLQRLYSAAGYLCVAIAKMTVMDAALAEVDDLLEEADSGDIYDDTPAEGPLGGAH
jgi:hypothetical protein